MPTRSVINKIYAIVRYSFICKRLYGISENKS